MELTTILTSPIGTNTYILTESGEALVIDPGMWIDKLTEELDQLQVKCSKVVLTHGHFDHASATADLQKKGAEVYVYYSEESLNNPIDSRASSFRMPYTPYGSAVPLHDGDNVAFGKSLFHVIHTPGHTSGSICLYDDGQWLFTGDTLFKDGIGRTDFPTGSEQDMRASLEKLRGFLDKKGNYKVFPGHGDATTLKAEIRTLTDTL